MKVSKGKIYEGPEAMTEWADDLIAEIKAGATPLLLPSDPADPERWCSILAMRGNRNDKVFHVGLRELAQAADPRVKALMEVLFRTEAIKGALRIAEEPKPEGGETNGTH